MLTKEQFELLDILRDLNFSVFGIAVTLFTVILSFIVTKKDELKLLAELNKKEDSDVLIIGKIKSARKYIKRLRRVCLHVVIIVFCSISIFFAGMFLHFLCVYLWQYYAIIILSLLIIIYILILLVEILIFYWRYSKV